MYLPQTPDNDQKILFVDTNKNKLYLLSGLSTLILMAGMILFVKNNILILPYSLFCAVTVFYLFSTYLIGLSGKDFDYEKHKRRMLIWMDEALNEDIDIYLPVCGEHIDLLRNTWKGVANLCIAQKKRPMVWVLDDSKSEDVRAMAGEFGFNYVTRPDNTLKKAGNLRNAFAKTKAKYFVIFDADFIPRQDFILNLMPYFYDDQNVSIVQSPQFFEVNDRQNFIQRGAGAVQELFYRLIQVNRDSFDAAICVGSNAIYRREHLVPFGGTAAIGYSEDVRTGFRLTATGKKVRYVPLNLSMGTCPETWQQFFTQYYRWSMGSLDLMLSKEFWVGKMKFMQRICYMTGMGYYLTTGLSVIMAFIPSVYLLIYRPDLIHWFNLIFAIPSFFVTVVFMKYWSKLPYGIHVLRVRNVASYAHLYAFRDLLFNTLEEWKPTGAKTSSQRYDSFKLFYALMTLGVPVLIVYLVGLRISEGHHYANFALLLAFTAFNAYVAIPVMKHF